MKAIVTVVGRDRVGIVADVSVLLARHDVNILDISQTIMGEYFTMMMLVDTSGFGGSFTDLADALSDAGGTGGLSIRIQREDIFKAISEV